MANWLRQSTATSIAMGPFVDSTDGVTPETALTITQPDVRLKKGAGDWAQKNAAQTLAHEENGWYEVDLDVTDTATVGPLMVAVYESGALPVWREFLVVPPGVYDSMVAGTAIDMLDLGHLIESQRGRHSWQGGQTFYVSPNSGNDTTGTGSRTLPYATVTKALSMVTLAHSVIHLLADNASGITTLTEAVTVNKRYVFIRGPGRDFVWQRTTNGATITVAAHGVELSGFQLESSGASATSYGISVADYDFLRVHHVWINATQGTGIRAVNSSNLRVHDCGFQRTGSSASGHGVELDSTGGINQSPHVYDNQFEDVHGDSIRIGGSGTTADAYIGRNRITGSTGWGINIQSGDDAVVCDNCMGENASGNINDLGTDTMKQNNGAYAIAGDAMALTTGAVTAAAIATDAIDADALAASAVTEIATAINGAVGARTVTITVTDLLAVPVSSVSVQIFDATDTNMIREETTNPSGVAVFYLDDATYKVHLVKDTFAPTNTPETLVVDANETVTYTGTSFTVPVAVSPNLCTVYGFAYDITGTAVNGAVIAFRANLPLGLDPNVLEETEVTVTTGPIPATPQSGWSNGYFEIDLMRLAAAYVRCTQLGIEDQAITIPDAASVELSTLI